MEGCLTNWQQMLRLQRLSQTCLITKGWVADDELRKSPPRCMSLYNPLELVSGNRKRMQKALLALMEFPQNNLRLWLGDQLVLGVMQESSSMSPDWVDILQSLNMNNKSMLVELLVKVLCRGWIPTAY